KSKLFGYKKQEVTEYIEKLIVYHESEIISLDKELRELQEGNTILENELKKLSEDLKYLNTVKGWDLSGQKIAKTAKNIIIEADEDIAKIIDDGNKDMALIHKKIKVIENEIKEAKTYIKTELAQIIQVIKASNFKLTDNGTLAEGQIIIADKLNEGENRKLQLEILENKMIAEIASVEDKGKEQIGYELIYGKKNKMEKNVGDKKNGDKLANEIESGTDVLSTDELRMKIDLMRYRYIIGKIAGEDIMDGSKNIIVKKNEPITSIVMEAAHREGKLSELIINMIIPGMDE
ncbi:MAG: hypothetical protein WCR27_07275, partial [Eubacteriales bacterium]